jgi:glutamate formiminotransferase
VGAIAAAFASAGARVADTHVDGDHNRAVITLLGSDDALEEGLLRGIDEACRRIDLSRHVGIHPRVGAADVVPVVPLDGESLSRALAVAHTVARRTGEELRVPVFLYGLLGGGLRPSFFRRGGPAELERRLGAGELEPAYGPRRIDERSGAVLVGVRDPLVAYNVALGGSLATAQEVAAAVREASGGLRGVQALGLELADGTVQVSTNIVDPGATAPHELVERIAHEATARGASVGRGELVGLIPARCVVDAAIAADVGVATAVGADGLPTDAALEVAAAALRLDELAADRVLEWHLVR